jgi:hypothetical protein
MRPTYLARLSGCTVLAFRGATTISAEFQRIVKPIPFLKFFI